MVRAWTPMAIPASRRIAWWDSMNLDSITSAANRVSLWTDTWNGVEASQTDGSSQPWVNVDSLQYGRPITFDGGNFLDLPDSFLDTMEDYYTEGVHVYTVHKSITVGMLLSCDGLTQVLRHYTEDNGGFAKVGTLVTGSLRADATSTKSVNDPIVGSSNAYPLNAGVRAIANAAIDLDTDGTAEENPLFHSGFIGKHAGGHRLQGYIAEMIVVRGKVTPEFDEEVRGYLAWKWGLQGDQPEYGYRNYPPVMPDDPYAWTPAAVDKLAWFDAANQDSITSAAKAISQWDDLSGKGNHAVQTVGANQPQVGHYDGGGLLVPSITGEKWFLLPNIANVRTAFMVYRDHGGLAAACLLGSTGDTGADKYAYHGYSDGTQLFDPVYAATETLNGDNRRNGTDIGDGLTTWRPQLNEMFTFVATATLPGVLQYLGRERFQDIRHILGGICEVILLDYVPDEDELQKIEGYLAWKWRLEGDLDAAHPYKAEAPQAYVNMHRGRGRGLGMGQGMGLGGAYHPDE